MIIGKPARHLTADNALDCVFGYSCFNDGSVRDYQRKSNQWTIGKNFDETGGFGPWIVTADEIPDPQNLPLWTEVNGKKMQNGSTKTMIFGVKTLVSYVSHFITLHAGDVIATSPDLSLAAGSTLATSISAISAMRRVSVLNSIALRNAMRFR